MSIAESVTIALGLLWLLDLSLLSILYNFPGILEGRPSLSLVIV